MPSHPRICPTLPPRTALTRAAPVPRVALACATAVAAFAFGPAAYAQFALPAPSLPPDGAKLFQNQCGTCHTLSASEPIRQGPPLGGVFGRPAGSVPGFKYSAGFATAGFTWDAQHLDAWLTNPQAVIPGAVMAYRQANPATRKQIIDWLKDQH
jgi:cytochrome c